LKLIAIRKKANLGGFQKGQGGREKVPEVVEGNDPTSAGSRADLG